MNVLDTPTLYRLPIEHLFKSIYILDLADELVRESDLLKQRMEDYFDQVKDKNGFKTYGNIRYYPNGLCESGTLVIVLSPWQSKSIPVEITQEQLLQSKVEKEAAKSKKPRTQKTCYKALDRINRFWCFQAKEFAKVPYSVGSLRLKKPFEETYALYKELKKLSTDTKTVLQEELTALQMSADQIVSVLFANQRRGSFLMDENTEHLLKLAKLSPNNTDETYFAMKKYVQSIVVTEELRYFRNHAYHKFDGYGSAYHGALMDELHVWLQSVDNPAALRVLKKLNIIA
jgi:hypothetical protein